MLKNPNYQDNIRKTNLGEKTETTSTITLLYIGGTRYTWNVGYAAFALVRLRKSKPPTYTDNRRVFLYFHSQLAYCTVNKRSFLLTLKCTAMENVRRHVLWGHNLTIAVSYTFFSQIT
jgi:hypothetical protein